MTDTPTPRPPASPPGERIRLTVIASALAFSLWSALSLTLRSPAPLSATLLSALAGLLFGLGAVFTNQMSRVEIGDLPLNVGLGGLVFALYAVLREGEVFADSVLILSLTGAATGAVIWLVGVVPVGLSATNVIARVGAVLLAALTLLTAPFTADPLFGSLPFPVVMTGARIVGGITIPPLDMATRGFALGVYLGVLLVAAPALAYVVWTGNG